MASIIFNRITIRHNALMALGLGLAGCAVPAPPAPIPAPAAAQAAVVVATRPLAPASSRGAVLLVLTGSPAHATQAPRGYDVIAQTADGSLKSCVAPLAAPRAGSTVLLADGARCTVAHIAAVGAIR